MAGYNSPALKPAEIKHAITNPIGMLPIRELAQGKKEVVILFDDMSRVTRVAQIVPHLLKELASAGIPDNRIRFIAALGCHGAMDRFDFVKKLGKETLSRFAVYNHNPFGNCIDIGTTSYGTRVFINAEVMKCDLKIGIGSIVPHIMAGFGGGAKILMPGVASAETIEALHHLPTTGMGIFANNPLRLNMEEAAAMAGLDMKIDCIVNMWGETVALFAGSPRHAYAAGIAKPCIGCGFCELICPTGAMHREGFGMVKVPQAVWKAVNKEFYLDPLAKAEAEGRFRRLAPVENVFGSPPLPRDADKHPKWIIGKGFV